MSNPCQYDGLCTDLVNAYNCTCLPGFTGANCQIDINECASDPCQHGGDCINLIDAYLCHCPLGYIGVNCQKDIDECISQPCQNGATCINLVNGFKCSCVNGYTGRNCETDIDECSSNPCYNNGTCVDKIASWSCACIPGYSGTQCQTDINECSSSPCQHNGTCINQINGYRCQCQNDSAGDNCQIWMDYCSSGPCLNGGVCLNRYDGYRCTCPQSWYGDICEYREINQTEVCSDLDYTECSCHVSKFTFIQRKSHRIQFGLVGYLSGLLGTIFFYIIWNLCRKIHDKNNKVNTRFHPRKNNIITLSDLEAEESRETSNKIVNRKSETDDIAGCDCFIDHTGYDHFQRFDKRLKYKYRFHNCRNKKGFKKENPAISKTRTH
ncbi:Neurogenic locus protein delta,Protein eyes shut homolog,Neurogenic locus Notch protein,Neurogenic locus notch homolog protein 3,Protein eyes shut,Protocadherin Fat 4,Delta and Notch-like epidermal growth factor-related receptor,Delta-like protein C,Protein slit,Neurogenic locus notch homolog protein 1,Fibropellin-3,Protein crumbs homolog 2,Sushi, nidogen and EGF-like domain-containing protein 1,Protein jagged-1a,Sushi, von Willebrand factor type A, EGF and pentraxin domain-containing protein 1,Protein jag|uniref:EGF-like domain-containing protein n=1 Tax=Mytilus coruscus TaxID=42192 RepID=A0A6J8EJ85_MYTCO|nr:Neurogenic locus protein delta,Protein eyes shut homolog,Neurogenic locus Notch protein,Neurogenic locus notch homolog protein 3,Protein eyes shut,Protocadherin Fat 4,Delta and Notch-like epidermal growth factor-related receptor,Delta-like protein C,Protein slit,Neurogenic locus notch homolog protein 1,Fibropellin-3,Protein crumbs homolog 2,Sushi, nidogen and EGF-like domain-containing protein 1,Protein jagged-1a,Sushi, von Willebrand factor type A, EGF and pentraxin domain-containing protein 1,